MRAKYSFLNTKMVLINDFLRRVSAFNHTIKYQIAKRTKLMQKNSKNNATHNLCAFSILNFSGKCASLGRSMIVNLTHKQHQQKQLFIFLAPHSLCRYIILPIMAILNRAN